MKASSLDPKRKTILFAALTSITFCAGFILAPLGSFLVWVCGGATAYFLFLSIYSLVPPERKRFTKTRFDPRQADTRAYIAFHKPILISVFLAGILLVVVILMMVL